MGSCSSQKFTYPFLHQNNAKLLKFKLFRECHGLINICSNLYKEQFCPTILTVMNTNTMSKLKVQYLTKQLHLTFLMMIFQNPQKAMIDQNSSQ